MIDPDELAEEVSKFIKEKMPSEEDSLLESIVAMNLMKLDAMDYITINRTLAILADMKKRDMPDNTLEVIWNIMCRVIRHTEFEGKYWFSMFIGTLLKRKGIRIEVVTTDSISDALDDLLN